MNTFKILPDTEYIIKKPTGNFCVVIEVNMDFPLSVEIHMGLENLKKAGFNIFFLFSSPQEFPAVKKINLLKFTSLYEAIGFTVIEKKSLAQEFIEIGKYFAETGIGFRGISFLQLSRIGSIKLEDLITWRDKFIAISTSGISSPVLNIVRRSPEELWEDYRDEDWDKEEDEVESEVIKPRFIDYFTGVEISPTMYSIQSEVTTERSYATHTSLTILPYFPSNFFGKFWDTIGDKDMGMEWWRSWVNSSDPIELISSGIVFFELPLLSQNTFTLDLSKPVK